MNAYQREKIMDLLQTNMFGVISYCSPQGTPRSAVVAISQTEQLEIVFGSFQTTRKNQDIRRNAEVSVVVGWKNSTTLQIEGSACLVAGAEREKLENNHCQKNPLSDKYRKDPRQEYFKITPRWIRYSNFSIDPQEVWEVDLPSSI